MQTIFQVLHRDHDVQRELLRNLSNTHGDSETRRSLWEILKQELRSHDKFEERYFYSALLFDDEVQKLSRHSIAEHKKIEDHIKKIEETEFSSPGWLVHLKNLKSLVEHHLDEEESEIFPVAGQVLERAEKNMLARKYKFEMEDSFADQVRH
ncbi:MAG: hemerythrin domain-containing protein [Bdellovibrionota bacterium]|nr:hemerythrin domain-containing protein [Bdellovibrionota bacterium]